MKFCFIAPGYRSVNVLNGNSSKSGGAEAQLAYIAAAFARLGHQVELIYGGGLASSVVRIISGVKCVDAYPTWKHPGSLLTFWMTLKKSAADMIYANLPDDFLWLPGLFSKLHVGSRLVYAIASDMHCNPWQAYDYNKWFHGLLYALGLRLADVISFQHERQAPLVRPHTKGELILVPNLVRQVAPEVRKYEETTIDAIWLAQIRPEKQLPVFLDVVERLPKIQFAIVGGFDIPDDMRTPLEDRMQKLPNLRFWGPQRFENVMKLLSQSKVLVNTSSWEGFSNAMLEAWSVGVPVVSLTADSGGTIQQEAIGLVSGTVTKLIHDIKLLTQTRSLNYEMGQRGLAYVRKKHSLEALCQAFESIMPGAPLLDRVKWTEVV